MKRFLSLHGLNGDLILVNAMTVVSVAALSEKMKTMIGIEEDGTGVVLAVSGTLVVKETVEAIEAMLNSDDEEWKA